MPAGILMTIRFIGGKPSLRQVAEMLHVQAGDMDADFGVVPIDPDQELYAVQVRAEALGPQDGAGGDVSGPFSNPRIAPMGPVRR